MLQKLSKELKALVVHSLEVPKDVQNIALTCRDFYDLIIPTYHSRFAPTSYDQYETIDAPKHISFRNLTTFSLVGTWQSHQCSYKDTLDSLVYNCSTLVDLSIFLYPYEDSKLIIEYPDLLRKATWPSLQRLTLTGSLSVFEEKASREDNRNMAVSFFSRHPLLRCLGMQGLPLFIEPFLDDEEIPMAAIFPSLKSFFSDCPFHSEILERLTHLSTTRRWAEFRYFDPAPLLQSCVLHTGQIRAFAEFIDGVSVDKLERLCLHYSLWFEDEDYCDDCDERGVDFEKDFDGIVPLLLQLKNLTHLGLNINSICEFAVNELRHHLLVNLPKLCYCRVWSEDVEDEWNYYHSKNANGGLKIGLVDEDWEEKCGPRSWGDFYTGDEYFDDSIY